VRSSATVWRWVALGLIVANFLAAGLGENLSNPRPRSDQEYYLELALSLREYHRFVQPEMNPFRPQDGLRPPHANRSPLYPALLAPLASRSGSFFWRAKWVTLTISVLLLPCVYLGTRKGWGDSAALLATFLLSLNASLVMHASRAAVDGPMVLMVFAIMLSADRALTGAGRWPLVGLLLGVGYWAKGSVVLLVPGIVAGLCLLPASPRLRLREALLVAVTALLVTSPWLLRNWVCFGSPTYNVNNMTFWMDTWDSPDDGFFIPRPPGAMPSAAAYIASHTPAEALRRFVKGAISVGRRLDEITGLRSPPVIRVDNLTGIALFLLGIWAMARERTGPRRMFMLVTVGVFVTFHAWYNPIAGPTRFVAVLAPYLLLYASSLLAPRLEQRWGRCCVRTSTVTFAFALMGLTQLASWAGADWRCWGGRMSPEDRVLAAQIAELTADTDTVATQPGHGFPWLYTTGRRDQWIPAYSDINRVTAFLQHWGVRYVVVSPELWDLRRYVLSPYVRRQGDFLLVGQRDPPGWKLIAGKQSRPVAYLIYEVAGDLQPAPTQSPGSDGHG